MKNTSSTTQWDEFKQSLRNNALPIPNGVVEAMVEQYVQNHPVQVKVAAVAHTLDELGYPEYKREARSIADLLNATNVEDHTESMIKAEQQASQQSGSGCARKRRREEEEEEDSGDETEHGEEQTSSLLLPLLPGDIPVVLCAVIEDYAFPLCAITCPPDDLFETPCEHCSGVFCFNHVARCPRDPCYGDEVIGGRADHMCEGCQEFFLDHGCDKCGAKDMCSDCESLHEDDPELYCTQHADYEQNQWFARVATNTVTASF